VAYHSQHPVRPPVAKPREGLEPASVLSAIPSLAAGVIVSSLRRSLVTANSKLSGGSIHGWGGEFTIISLPLVLQRFREVFFRSLDLINLSCFENGAVLSRRIKAPRWSEHHGAGNAVMEVAVRYRFHNRRYMRLCIRSDTTSQAPFQRGYLSHLPFWLFEADGRIMRQAGFVRQSSNCQAEVYPDRVGNSPESCFCDKMLI
jgi:hypothetical protein